MATLNVVQKNGWGANTSDQYQFHIILGSKIKSQKFKIKQLESDWEALDDESQQMIFCYRVGKRPPIYSLVKLYGKSIKGFY
jgi:hypothetical protein